MTIRFMRGAPYTYQQAQMNLYQSFDAVATDQIDPPILTTGLQQYKDCCTTQQDGVPVYCSDRRRSFESALLLTKQPIVLEELHEVFYSMHDFISEADFFDQQGEANIRRARKAFVHALVSDGLKESYSQVMGRIQRLLHRLQEQERDSICISHGFLLKIIKTVMEKPQVQQDPLKLLTDFDGETETFHFGDGFSIILDDKLKEKYGSK